jgi:hypothetical protein
MAASSSGVGMYTLRPDLVVMCIAFYLSQIGLAQTDDTNNIATQAVDHHMQALAIKPPKRTGL